MMKAPPSSAAVRALRPPPPSRDHRPSHILLPLLPSSFATSSRVRLPSFPSHLTPPACGYSSQHRYFTTSPPLRSPNPSPKEVYYLEAKFGSPFAELPGKKRAVHTSAPVRAQPIDHAEYGSTAYEDVYSGSGGGDRGDWADNVPIFTAEEIAGLSGIEGFNGKGKGKGVRYRGPPRVPGTPVPEYEPSEADFVAGLDTAMSADEAIDTSWADGYEGDKEEYSRSVEVWEDPVKEGKKVKKRRKRVTVSQLPLLPVGESLEVGEERYDWRMKALSQLRLEEKGKERWFPHLNNIRRARVKIEELEEGEKYFEEVQRYGDHFIPLLEAERKEELLAHAERQFDWSEERLKHEGYMIEDLGASPYPVKNKPGLVVYTFNRVGKAAVKDGGNLAFHKFTPGTVTEICRTTPFLDYVKPDGTTNVPMTDGGLEHPRSADENAGLVLQSVEKLLGSVYSVTKKYIRVAFEVPIKDIEYGCWRLDTGLNDVSYKRQLEAIRYLNADPTMMERNDAHIHASSSKSPYTVSPYRSDEDEAFNEPTRGRVTQQTVLQGMNLRDKLLRAFQEPFIPYDTSASLRLDDKLISPAISPIPTTTDLHPGDIDATPIPPPHAPWEPLGVLAQNELIASWTKRYRADDGRPAVRVEGDPIVPLNQSQVRAIAMILSERLSLVQGPPGTGKTRLIIEAIKLLKQFWKVPHPILVSAHTNAAVDNLLGGLRAHNVKAVRVGRDEVVREDVRQWTVGQLAESHPLYKRYDELEIYLKELKVEMAKLNDSVGAGQDRKPSYNEPRSSSYIDLLRKKISIEQKLRSMKRAMTRDILYDADVICTTCLTAASYELEGIDFPIVFLDEASMATETLSLVPLMKGSSHVAIIGDHKQLPPIILSETAQLGGLATSMFERLIHERNIPSIMLDTQYRMHPQISAFPNKAFYASALTDGTILPDGNVKPGLTPPETDFLVENDEGVRQNVTFVHHDSAEDPNNRSLRNPGEAQRVCDVVADLLHQNPTLSGSDIGIITPYTAQIRQLTSYLRDDLQQKDKFINLLGIERVEELGKIEIKTVDGFEGREKAVIIFSTVRNNPGGYIGFLADWRRLNVGLTRAKRALIMIGSADHLARSKVGAKALQVLPAGGAQVWRDLISWLDKEGLILREEDHEDLDN